MKQKTMGSLVTDRCRFDSRIAAAAVILFCILGNFTSGTAAAGTGTGQARCGWPDASALDAVLPVAAEDGSYASGVVVQRNKVLTAAHALSSTFRVFVSINEEYRPARILMIDRLNDLAILSVDTGQIPPLEIASTELLQQQPVWAVGFPRASDKETSAGVFTRESHGALHTSAPIDLGQSGGGLLQCVNGAFQLAGMLRGYGAYVKGDQFIKLENHSVSVAAATIQRFVDSPSLTAANSHITSLVTTR